MVSVMPPMAIFFLPRCSRTGYLPRVAFQLDRWCASERQVSLTMCMGFGCNACGVTGCRIIDSPRSGSAISPTALRRATDGFRCSFFCARCFSRAARQAARCC
ncbi:MAG: hypothetical protein ACLT2F_10010 [Butyricicoccus sp.]